MFKKPFTTISIATLAVLGAFAMSVEGASAGFSGHGFGVSFHSGHSDHGSWGHDDWATAVPGDTMAMARRFM